MQTPAKHADLAVLEDISGEKPKKTGKKGYQLKL
jgi:hypothetical protein